MIWMGQNTNHLQDKKATIDAMIDCIKSHGFEKYPAPEGFPELKKLILKDLNLNDNFEALITAGGTEALYLTMNVLLSEKDNVITPDPGYGIIDNFAGRFAGEIRPVDIYSPDNNYKLTPELVKQNMDENTKIIVLIDPLNPLGSGYTDEEIKEFAKIAEENNLYLLHDITYRDFAENHTLATKYTERAVIAYSFSKIFGMAGLRLGAIVSNTKIIDAVRTIIINDVGTNVVAQAGAIAALKTKSSWVNELYTQCRKNQELIKEAVDQVEGTYLPVYPSQGNMMIINIKETGVDSEVLAEYLLEKKLFVRQGSYTSAKYGHEYIRISFSIPEEQIRVFTKEFIEAIEYLRKK